MKNNNRINDKETVSSKKSRFNIFTKIPTYKINFRFTSIKIRLIFSYIMLIFLPIMSIGFLAYYKSSNALENSISSSSNQTIQQLAFNERLKLDAYERLGEQIIYSDNVQKTLRDYSTLDYVTKTSLSSALSDDMSTAFDNSDSTTGNGGLGTLAIITNNGDVLGQSTIKNEDISSIKEKAIKNAGSYDRTLYVEKSGDNITVISKLIKDVKTNANLGVFIIGIYDSTLSSGYSNTSFGDNSEITIIDSNNTVISSKNEKIIGKKNSNTEIMNSVLENEKSIGSVSDNDKQNKRKVDLKMDSKSYLITYSPIKDTDWYIVASIPYSYIDSTSAALGKEIFFIGIGVIIVAMIIAMLISNSISKPMNSLVKLMDKAKDGNLDLNISDKSNDEMGKVTKSFSDMLKKLSGLISNIKNISGDMSESATDLVVFSENNLATSEQIEATMDQIVEKTNNQVSKVNDGTIYMDKLSSKINSVNSEMEDMLIDLRNIKIIKDEAAKFVELLNEKTVDTDKASKSILGNVYELNTNMKEIVKIMDVINGIAEKTNLLSLNAAIEAARVGEAGKGFSVVAEEIRKLSFQSKGATEQIRKIVGDIENTNNLVIDHAVKSSDVISQEIEIVNKSADAFKRVFIQTDEISAKIEDVAISIDDILEIKNKIVNAIQTILAFSQEIAADTQEAIAATNEQVNKTQKLTDLVEDINNVVSTLNNAVSIFKFEENALKEDRV